MSIGRQLPERDYLALKAAFRDLVAAAGGAVRAAQMTRVNSSLVSRYGAPHEELFPPADVVADLEAEAGAPVFSRAAAKLGGFLLVPEAAAAAPAASIASGAIDAIGALADLAKRVHAALDDGNCSAAEALRIRPIVHAAAAELAELDLALAACADGARVNGAAARNGAAAAARGSAP